MSAFNGFSFAWDQPAESKLNEALGADSNRVVATLKTKGGAANRRLLYTACTEYPSVTRLTGPPIQVFYTRNPPMPYEPALFTDPTPNTAYLYLTKPLNGQGRGPQGQDAATPPMPAYQYYYYDCEFTDRSYDFLADADVEGPNPLPTVPVLNNPTAGIGGQFGANQYFFVVTAIQVGETVASNEKAITLTAGQSVNLTWSAVAGAVAYRVYIGLLSGQEVLMAGTTTATSFTVYSFSGSAATPPILNESGSPVAGHPDEGTYLALGNGSIGGRYVTRNSRQANRGVTIPGGVYNYQVISGTTRAIPTSLLQVEPCIELVYTHHMVPRSGVPNQAIVNCEGALNAYPFDGWPAATVLLNAVEKRYYRTARGDRVVDLQYPMTFLPHIDRRGYPQGHNSALGYLGGAHDGGGPTIVDYVPVNSDPSFLAQSPYRMVDFSTLFRPDQI